jgi:hypothetical protein
VVSFQKPQLFAVLSFQVYLGANWDDKVERRSKMESNSVIQIWSRYDFHDERAWIKSNYILTTN